MTLGDANLIIAILALVGGLIAGVLGAAFVLWRWVAGTIRIASAEADAKIKDIDSLIEARSNDLHTRISTVRDLQQAFELEVAKHYASDDRLHEIEVKFTASIDKLINRFDAFAADFHRIVGRLERTQGEAAK